LVTEWAGAAFDLRKSTTVQDFAAIGKFAIGKFAIGKTAIGTGSP
jgi:hypothetical protein